LPEQAPELVIELVLWLSVEQLIPIVETITAMAIKKIKVFMFILP
jgi:hypothetical protein